MKKLSFFHTP